MKNLIQKILLSTFLFSSILIPNASAEIIHVNADGSILQADIETQAQAMNRALSTAMRNAAMTAGSRVYSMQTSSDNIIEEDQIQLSTVSFIHLEGEPEFEYEADKAFNSKIPVMIIHCQISATVDSDEVKQLLQSEKANETIRNSRTYIDEGNRIASEYETAIKNYVTTEDDSEREKIAADLKKNSDEFTANEHFERGWKLQDEDKNLEAIEEYSKAIELNPDYELAYNNRGLAYYNLNEYETAIRDYNRAIKVEPDFAFAYYNRGSAYHKLGRYDEAMQDYNKSLELDPTDADVYNNRGMLFYDLEQYNDAMDDFKISIKINPANAEPYNNRGLVYYTLGQYSEAVDEYTRAIEINPELAVAYYNRGVAYCELEKYDEALADFQKAVELNPDDQDAQDYIEELQESLWSE